MWPFNQKNDNVVTASDEEKLFKFQITYTDTDKADRTIIANEFNWNEHDIVFNKGDMSIFWVRAVLVSTIECCGEESPKPPQKL